MWIVNRARSPGELPLSFLKTVACPIAHLNSNYFIQWWQHAETPRGFRRSSANLLAQQWYFSSNKQLPNDDICVTGGVHLEEKHRPGPAHTRHRHRRAAAPAHCEAVSPFLNLQYRLILLWPSFLTRVCLHHTECYTIKYSVLVVVLHRTITQLYSLEAARIFIKRIINN